MTSGSLHLSGHRLGGSDSRGFDSPSAEGTLPPGQTIEHSFVLPFPSLSCHVLSCPVYLLSSIFLSALLIFFTILVAPTYLNWLQYLNGMLAFSLFIISLSLPSLVRSQVTVFETQAQLHSSLREQSSLVSVDSAAEEDSHGSLEIIPDALPVRCAHCLRPATSIFSLSEQ